MASKVCTLSMVPMRKEPNHRSEMVSQMLLGETAQVLSTEKEWLLIKMDFDKYEGWVETQALHKINPASKAEKHLVKGAFLPVEFEGVKIYLPAGSELEITPDRDVFSVADNKFKIANPAHVLRKSESLVHSAELFLNSPYLWGGRTAMGIDCSGFMQVVFKMHEIKLARDASDQALQGILVNTIKEVKIDDLLFFQNKEGKVTHVGLYMGEGSIIHASIHVRIDKVDKKGIFNSELGEYTHSLHSIRRI